MDRVTASEDPNIQGHRCAQLLARLCLTDSGELDRAFVSTPGGQACLDLLGYDPRVVLRRTGATPASTTSYVAAPLENVWQTKRIPELETLLQAIPEGAEVTVADLRAHTGLEDKRVYYGIWRLLSMTLIHRVRRGVYARRGAAPQLEPQPQPALRPLRRAPRPSRTKGQLRKSPGRFAGQLPGPQSEEFLRRWSPGTTKNLYAYADVLGLTIEQVRTHMDNAKRLGVEFKSLGKVNFVRVK
jgi:hypothetical protein